MISLCENNKDADDIVIYFIGVDVSEVNINSLRNIADQYKRKFVYIPFDSIAYDLNISAIGRHIKTIYTKVFFSRIEGLDKIIYLDSDTIVNGSLKPLWDDDISKVYMGVVQTCTKANKALGMPDEMPFFNDGMAIVNVDFCRENGLIQKVLDVVKYYNGNPPVLSEGALNKVCMGNVKYISPRWNMMAGVLYFGLLNIKKLQESLDQYSLEDLSESCKSPVVIHYLTAFYNRPWFTPCTHPYKDRYYYYQSLSPWKDVKPTLKPLPLRIKAIDYCYRYLGVSITNAIRKVMKN